MADDTVPTPAADGTVPAPVADDDPANWPEWKKKRPWLKQFQKGFDPRRNVGRALNAKNVISNSFVKDLMKWHAKHGMKAIEKVGREQPVELLKIIASFVPKKVDIEHEHTGSVTIEPVSVQEVERRTRELLSRVIDGTSEDVSAG